MHVPWPINDLNAAEVDFELKGHRGFTAHIHGRYSFGVHYWLFILYFMFVFFSIYSCLFSMYFNSVLCPLPPIACHDIVFFIRWNYSVCTRNTYYNIFSVNDSHWLSMRINSVYWTLINHHHQFIDVHDDDQRNFSVQIVSMSSCAMSILITELDMSRK